MKGVEGETLEGWHRLIAIDQTGVWLGMRAAMPHLRASGNGAIVNMSSTLGMMGTSPASPSMAPRARSG